MQARLRVEEAKRAALEAERRAAEEAAERLASETSTRVDARVAQEDAGLQMNANAGTSSKFFEYLMDFIIACFVCVV